MSVETLLSRLGKIRRMGKDRRWMACCPAHGDKNPSLSIRECDDGTVLIHCWTGCSVESILDSVGLTFDDLFPEKAIDNYIPKQRVPFTAREALAAMVPETFAVALIAHQMMTGKANDEKTQQALITAASRLSAAHSYVEGL